MLTQEALLEYNMEFSADDIKIYQQYLNTITEVLDGYFEDQKEYICCKKGCSYCCEEGEYPYSKLEFTYLLMGFFSLPMDEQRQVILRIKKLKQYYNNRNKDEKFSHRCPFLGEDNVCMVYNYRGLICRTFGLITQYESGKYSLPFCYSLGLNYSKIYDPNTKKIDYDLVKKYGYKKMPYAHKTNLKTLMSPKMFVGEPLQFGEIKPLIEWL